MSSSAVIAPKDIDLSKIRYSEPKSAKGIAIKKVYINYGTGGKLTFQTPIMRMPFGITDVNEMLVKTGNKKSVDENDEKKYDINIEFNDRDNNPKMAIFYDKMVALQDKIIKDVYENRVKWIGQDSEDDDYKYYVKTGYPIVKVPKDKDTGKPSDRYPPFMKIKVPYDSENNKIYSNFDTYNMETNERINLLDELQSMKDGQAQMVIQVVGIWFAGNKFGITLRPIMGRFKSGNVSKYGFIQDSDDEEAVPTRRPSAPAVRESPIIDSEAESDESEDNYDEEIAPAPSKAGTSKAAPVPEPESEESESEEEAPPPPPKPARKPRK